jgi:hypothetical protein
VTLRRFSLKKDWQNPLAKNSMLGHESNRIGGIIKKLLNSLVISLIRPLSKQWQEVYEK